MFTTIILFPFLTIQKHLRLIILVSEINHYSESLEDHFISHSLCRPMLSY